MKPGDSTPRKPKPADLKPLDLKTLKQEIIRKYPPDHIERLVRPSIGAVIQSLVGWIAAAPAGVIRRYEVNVVRFPFDFALSYEGHLPLYTVTLDVELGADADTQTLIGRGVASDGIPTNLLLRVAATDPTKANLAWWRDGTDFHFAQVVAVGGKWKVMYAAEVDAPTGKPFLFTVTFVREVSLP